MVLMVLHLFRPLGLPGLKRRRDFWKIAIVMIVAVLAAAILHQRSA